MDKKMKLYLEETKSWLTTLVTEMLVDLAAGILIGLGTLAETGSITTAAIMALVTATARTVLKAALIRTGKEIKKLK